MKWKKFNAAVIDEFRRKGGKVARFGGLPLIVLQTVSATSSQRLDVPLIPVFDERSMFVFATNAGSQQDPDWVENLRCQPEISVEYEQSVVRARIAELPRADADVLLQAKAVDSQQLQDYLKSASPRQVPVFEVNIRPVLGSEFDGIQRVD